MNTELRADLEQAWHRAPFAAARAQTGEIYRQREGRRTLRFAVGDRHYFLKYHQGVGWREICKNLLQLKKPVLGADAEYRAIRAIAEAGLDTLSVAAFGSRGHNPARRESFLVTDELTHCLSLEAWGEQQPGRRFPPAFKADLIERIARMVRTMHDAGVNHRDLYLGHFLMQESALNHGDAKAPLHLIDLHRSQVRRHVPRRWLIKDLAGLYFSVARFDFRRRDLWRFMRAYAGTSLRQTLKRDGRFWQQVRREAERVYRRYYEVEPRFPLQYADHPGKDI